MSIIESNIWRNNYTNARKLFRKYTKMNYQKYFSDKRYGNFVIDDNEDTTIDYLFLHNSEKQNQKLNIIISGTHGVEGYPGSVMQCTTLDSIIKEKDIYDTERTSYLFIHALNPYGYFHNRRCTKNNVDLNRNYLDKFQTTDYPQQIYELITTYLYSFKFIFLFFSILFQYGYTKSREYIVKGQYNYDKGLFYGGEKREYNIDVLENILNKVNISSYADICIYDIHTGLGKYGNLSVMVQNHTYEKITKFICLNGTTEIVNVSLDSMYQDSKGSITEGIEQYFKRKSFEGSIYPIILEYGTYSNIQIFIGLVLENYYYINNSIDWYIRQNKLRKLFFPDKKYWKLLVLSNYDDIMSQFNCQI